MTAAIIAIILFFAFIIYSQNDRIKIQTQNINSLNKETSELKSECEDLTNILEFRFEVVEKKYKSEKLSSITRNKIHINKSSVFFEDTVKIKKYEYDSKGELSKVKYFGDNLDIFDETEYDISTQCSKYDVIERIESENALKTISFRKFMNSWTPIKQTIEYPINSKNKSSIVYDEFSENHLGKAVVDRTTIFRYTHDQLGNKIECFEEGEKDSARIIYKYDANQNLIEESLYRNPTEDNHREIEIVNENIFKKREYCYNQNGVLTEKRVIYFSPGLDSVKYNYINGGNNNSILEGIKSLYLKKETVLSKNDLQYLKMIDVLNKTNPINIEIYKNEVRVNIEKIS